MKGFRGISMNDTYWEMFLISNTNILEIQKAMQATEALTIAGHLSMPPSHDTFLISATIY